jgi:acetoacetyl-CoA synthetase
MRDTIDWLDRHDLRGAASVQLLNFTHYCETSTGQTFPDYYAFEAFAIAQFRDFWSLFWRWSDVACEGRCDPVCSGNECETAAFFPHLRLNYAENLLDCAIGRTRGDVVTLIGRHADGSSETLTRSELRAKVRGFATVLQSLGVKPGDRVAAIARSNVEVIIAALASAAIGAVFSSCSHDMGPTTALSRFQPLRPKVLIANCVSKFWDSGKRMAERIGEVAAGLPSLTAIIALDGELSATVPVFSFAEAVAGDPDEWVWERFPFNHPLFIVFSSGTTGAPKCIVHGVGGTLLEHLKEHRLHGDLDSYDRMFFQTSCGWMMWNWQLSALACGAEVVVYDGPLQGVETLWEIVAEEKVTVLGTNPAYIQFSEAVGYSPKVLICRRCGVYYRPARSFIRANSIGSGNRLKKFQYKQSRAVPISSAVSSWAIRFCRSIVDTHSAAASVSTCGRYRKPLGLAN